MGLPGLDTGWRSASRSLPMAWPPQTSPGVCVLTNIRHALMSVKMSSGMRFPGLGRPRSVRSRGSS